MSSQVGGNLDNIQTGPSKVTYKGEACGHTINGVKFTVTPDLRERKVDEYGTYVVDMIHQGDKVEVKTTFAEKSMQVLQTVYVFGYSIDENTWGIGVTPGQKASDKAGILLLHPLNGEDTKDDVQFWKAVVSTTGEVNFGTVTDDRVFDATFTMMIDETKDSGQLIGVIGTSIEV